MTIPSVTVIGLPASGKTTFLAALWHVVSDCDPDAPIALRLQNLKSGDVAHLNSIASRWREAKEQERTTLGGNHLVSMNLQDVGGNSVVVSFPDVEGEAYDRIWEDRECSELIEPFLKSTGVILFIHADKIVRPRWIAEEMALEALMNGPAAEAEGEQIPMPDAEMLAPLAVEPQNWEPKFAPTQVKLVDLLQVLRRPPLDIGPRKLAIMLSAWDKVEAEGRSPDQWLRESLPLLHQYLHSNADEWDIEIFGVSAQGGDYDSNTDAVEPRPAAAELRMQDRPADRIKLIEPTGGDSKDITRPIAWLMK